MKLIPGLDIDSATRIIWVSGEAKKIWSGIIQDINAVMHEAEVTSVIAGHRPASWQTIQESSYLQYSKDWAEAGLVSIPIRRVGSFSGFAHRHTPVNPNGGNMLCVIIAKDLKTCLAFAKAQDVGDNLAQGDLLGYPRCCSEFFTEVWKNGYYDPIWQAAERTEGAIRDGNTIRLKGNPLSNSALRYVGLRIGFHISHSFDCQETINISRERLGLLKEKRLVDLAVRLMSMPMEWNVFHGIVLVKTPIFYIEAASVPAAEKYTVEIEGDTVPEGSAVGIRFPFTKVKELEDFKLKQCT